MKSWVVILKSHTPHAPLLVLLPYLKTSWWNDKRGLHSRKDITPMKSLSKGYQILEEDAKNIGASQVAERIENLGECEDGLYTVITCNESHDWETGYVDDYDYRLIPYRP